MSRNGIHTFELVSPGEGEVRRRNYPVSDSGLVDPASTSPLCLKQGELVYINTSGQLVRVTSSRQDVFFVADIPGDSSAQSLSKLSIYEPQGKIIIRTQIYDHARSYTIGQQVGAKTVTISGQSRAGLTNDLSSGNYAIGVVDQLVTGTDDGAWLQVRLYAEARAV